MQIQMPGPQEAVQTYVMTQHIWHSVQMNSNTFSSMFSKLLVLAKGYLGYLSSWMDDVKLYSNCTWQLSNFT